MSEWVLNYIRVEYVVNFLFNLKIPHFMHTYVKLLFKKELCENKIANFSILREN